MINVRFDIFTLNILDDDRSTIAISQKRLEPLGCTESDIRKQNEKLCITNENKRHVQEIGNCWLRKF